MISAILVSRGSERARLVWLGVLVYLVYTYVISAFVVQFNPLFLVYVALLGCSLYALIGSLATTDFAGVKARFTEKTPVRATSIFLAVMVIATLRSTRRYHASLFLFALRPYYQLSLPSSL